jgi:hypothetical protein
MMPRFSNRSFAFLKTISTTTFGLPICLIASAGVIGLASSARAIVRMPVISATVTSIRILYLHNEPPRRRTTKLSGRRRNNEGL